ncbi:hypothetical protein V6U90_07155 [Micromonospora sp. CPCC 206060]|uniref:hypothetical protein n=1 Tax=Micromonospora sp. CPCC 206060 TaxID=3122406 RepID=UPI002FF08224
MIIEARFNGPPGSGNGGYCAGRFAAALTGDDPAEVTLLRPPPLDVPLTAVNDEIRDPEGTVIARVRSAGPVDATVPGVDRATAVTASTGYRGFVDHPFPTCYVCGPQAPAGLRIFPGPLPDARTAAPFVVPEAVGPAVVWAALDCPGGWAVIAPGRPYVLGRIAAEVFDLPTPGTECIVVGALIGTEGRKALVHSTLYAPDGMLLARARATWIALPPAG